MAHLKTPTGVSSQSTGASQPAAALRVSVEPGGVELRLFLDARVQLEDLSDRHGGVGGGRQGELHPQSPILPLCGRKEGHTGSEGAASPSLLLTLFRRSLSSMSAGQPFTASTSHGHDSSVLPTAHHSM